MIKVTLLISIIVILNYQPLNAQDNVYRYVDYGCKLELPDSVFQMKNITKLFIRSPEPYIDPLKGYVEKDCYFKDLSEKVISLDKLNTIGFYRTQFESIPTVLDEIKSLENLYFYKNYGIISLKNIPKMKNLKRLSLDECTVIKVNRKIKRLKSLEVITLRFTDISEEELDKLKKYLPNVKVEFIIPEYKKYYQKT